MTPEDGIRVGLQFAMTHIVSGMVRELICMEIQVLVMNGWSQPRGIHSENSIRYCARNCPLQQQGNEEGGGGRNLLPITVPHVLIKEGQQGIREIAAPLET